MKTSLLTLLAFLFLTGAQAQTLKMAAGGTTGLSAHRIFEPPDSVECTIFNHPVVYNLDVNQDGFNDLYLSCDYSYGALGLASYYLTAQALDSNEICYGTVDSSHCYNGYKPMYLAKLFNFGDTISDEMTFRQGEIIFSKVFWIMKDTCPYSYASSGSKYMAVRLNSHGIRGLAWVSLELFAPNGNGFSADVKETGFLSGLTSVPEQPASGPAIYPVPATGTVSIEVPEANLRSVMVVTDLAGHLVLQKELNSNITQISLNPGAYLVRITDRWNRVQVRKCVVL